MTLSTEQCIEVAEKVWKMSPLDLARLRFDGGGYAPPDGLEYIDNYRNSLVKSWQGFGRTVEAMAKRKWVLSDSPDGGLCLFSHLGKTRNLDLTDDYENPKKLIEATHLAALETIVNDTSKA